MSPPPMQFSAVSTGENSKFTEQQARQDQALRAAVMAIQEKRPDCSLEEVEQEMTKEIDVSSDVASHVEIGESDLRASVGDGGQSERRGGATQRNHRRRRLSVASHMQVGRQVAALEQWLFEHNSRLGVMTHSLQTITRENKSLTQQRVNHEALKTTLQVAPEATRDR